MRAGKAEKGVDSLSKGDWHSLQVQHKAHVLGAQDVHSSLGPAQHLFACGGGWGAVSCGGQRNVLVGRVIVIPISVCIGAS